MIEIVHYMNRYGKKMVAVFPGLDTLTWLKDAPPQVGTYIHRYHAGLEKPHYPLPVLPITTHAFVITYCLALVDEFFKEWGGS